MFNIIREIMKINYKVAVIGGTGKSGKYVVQQLLNKGLQIKVLVRNPQNFTVHSPLVEVVLGNVSSYDTVLELLKDCNALISTLGTGIPPSKSTIFSTATNNIISAMQILQLKKYVVVTGLNVNTIFDKKSPKTKFSTDWMYTNFPEATADRQKEYELLQQSNLDWTLVRLPLIELTEEEREVDISLIDCIGEKISATNLALFLIQQLEDDTYVGEAPFIYNL